MTEGLIIIATPICLGNDFENRRGDVFEKCFNGFSRKLGKGFGHGTDRCRGLDRLLDSALVPGEVMLRYDSTYNRLLLLAYQLFLLEALVEAGDSIAASGAWLPPFPHRLLGTIGQEDYLKCVKSYSVYLDQADLTTLFAEFQGLWPVGFQVFQLTLQRDLLTLWRGVKVFEPVVQAGDELGPSLTPWLDAVLKAKPPTSPNFVIIPQFPVHLVPPENDLFPLMSANAPSLDLMEMRHAIVALLRLEPGPLGADRPAPISEMKEAGTNTKVPKDKASGPRASAQGRPVGAATAPLRPQLIDAERTRWSEPSGEARSQPQEVRTSLRQPNDDKGLAVAWQDAEGQRGHPGRTPQPKDGDESSRDGSSSAGGSEHLEESKVPISQREIVESAVLNQGPDDLNPDKPEQLTDAEGIWMTSALSENRPEYLDPVTNAKEYGLGPENGTIFDPVHYPWLRDGLNGQSAATAAAQGDSGTSATQVGTDGAEESTFGEDTGPYDLFFSHSDSEGFTEEAEPSEERGGDANTEERQRSGTTEPRGNVGRQEPIDLGDKASDTSSTYNPSDDRDADNDSGPR